MTMTRRGLTLLELIITLALSSMLAVAAAGWMQTTSSACVTQTNITLWRASAQAVLALIERDLTTGDFPPADQNRSSAGRIEIDELKLRIQTRVNGAAGARTYEFDRATGELHSIESGKRASQKRLLLQLVERWECEYDEGSDTLRIELGGPHGALVTREVRIP